MVPINTFWTPYVATGGFGAGKIGTPVEVYDFRSNFANDRTDILGI